MLNVLMNLVDSLVDRATQDLSEMILVTISLHVVSILDFSLVHSNAVSQSLLRAIHNCEMALITFLSVSASVSRLGGGVWDRMPEIHV